MNDRTPTVFVVDDDVAVCTSLRLLLRSVGLPAVTCSSAAEFLAQFDADCPGCIVLDIRMPGMSGIELQQVLNERHSVTPIVFITGHGDVPMAVEAMKIGASDFLEKPFDDTALLQAVRSCLAEQKGDGERMALRARILERIATLTNREQQVLHGLVAGKPNKIIAFDHGISPRTVEIYRANVMTKMEAATLSDLVKMAILAGVLDNASAPEVP
jgi:two-component system response regulator FixJ